MTGKNSKDDGIDRYHDIDVETDTAAQLRTIYADWADSYDDDNDNKLGTVSQPTTVEMLSRHRQNRNSEILDVGCGTGLVGLHLARAGFKNYDGTDLSAEMMDRAKTHGYRNLFTLEADRPLPVPDNRYDVTLCVGVFTHGHLGVEGFGELLRITKPGGLICFTVNEGIWDVRGFPDAIARLTMEEQWQVLEQEKRDYMINENVRAWYITARKQSAD